MAEIFWSKSAKRSFQRTIDYLIDEFSEKEADEFVGRSNTLLSKISKFPEMFPCSISNEAVRKALVSKNCTLYYSTNGEKVMLLLFCDNRQDPKNINVH